MATFTDSTGASRELSLTIGKARKIAKDKDFDLDFLDGQPAKISNDLNIRVTLQVDLIWELMADKGELTREVFEDTGLDGKAFAEAKEALFSEVENFIQSTRPAMLTVFQESTRLMKTQVTKSVETVVSLLQSEEVKAEFTKANARATDNLQQRILNEFSKLPEPSE